MAPSTVDQPISRKWMPRTPAMQALAFTAVVVALAVLVRMIFSSLVGDAPDSCQSEAIFSCMSANRLILTFAPIVILALGGLAAFTKTLRVWKARGQWQIWLASGWFLFVMMVIFVGTLGGALIIPE